MLGSNQVSLSDLADVVEMEWRLSFLPVQPLPSTLMAKKRCVYNAH